MKSTRICSGLNLGARCVQVVIGASILMAGAYAVKQLLGPYAVSWYRRFYGIEPKPEEDEKQAQLKQTAEIVAEAIQSQVRTYDLM